jgi:hypothetical protein
LTGCGGRATRRRRSRPRALPPRRPSSGLERAVRSDASSASAIIAAIATPSSAPSVVPSALASRRPARERSGLGRVVRAGQFALADHVEMALERRRRGGLATRWRARGDTRFRPVSWWSSKLCSAAQARTCSITGSSARDGRGCASEPRSAPRRRAARAGHSCRLVRRASRDAQASAFPFSASNSACVIAPCRGASWRSISAAALPTPPPRSSNRSRSARARWRCRSSSDVLRDQVHDRGTAAGS